MKVKKLKSVISQLPKTSGQVKELLNNPQRFDVAAPIEMSVEEFIIEWNSTRECLRYIKNCSSGELLSLSDLLTLMSDGTPIDDCIFNGVKLKNSIEQLEVCYSDIVILIPYHITIMNFVHWYMMGKIKPIFTLKKLVKSLTK